MPKPITISMPRNNEFDEWRRAKVGAVIIINRRGLPEYKFETKAMFDQYLKLNSKREMFNERKVLV